MAFVSSVSSSERAGWTKDQHRGAAGRRPTLPASVNAETDAPRLLETEKDVAGWFRRQARSYAELLEERRGPTLALEGGSWWQSTQTGARAGGRAARAPSGSGPAAVQPERPPASSSAAPMTPPKQTQGRAREETTPPSGGSTAPPPRKAQKQAASSARPAACHGLSFPVAGSAGPSDAHRGYSMEVQVTWNDPKNKSGILAATSALRHCVMLFARRQTLGCSVEAMESVTNIVFSIDGIHARADPGGLPKDFQKAIHRVSMSRSRQVRGCHFSTRLVAHNARSESDVLAMFTSKPRVGFKSWFRRAPDPEVLVDAAPAADNPAPPAPGAVVAALDADIASLSDNVRSNRSVRASLNIAIHTLGVLRTHLSESGLASGGAPVAATPPESSTPPPAAGSEAQAGLASGEASSGAGQQTPVHSPSCVMMWLHTGTAHWHSKWTQFCLTQ